MSKEIKVFQSRNLSEYSKKLVELVKAGNEVLLDQCISLFGKVYTIKYYEPEAEVVEETVEENAVSSDGVTTKAVKKSRGGSASTK